MPADCTGNEDVENDSQALDPAIGEDEWAAWETKSPVWDMSDLRRSCLVTRWTG